MPGPGAVQVILDTLSWMSALWWSLVFVLEDCCGVLLDPLATNGYRYMVNCKQVKG